MNEYLREKWLHLRLYRRKGGFTVDYQILRNMAKMMGAKHELRSNG
ncbi:YlcG family protein [Mixta calida]|nr:YlcG family protein [Mixta calida]MDU6539139.1 YlcG family protein [Mixta calida]